MKTLAAILYKLRQPLVVEELEVPALRSGQVLVKIAAAGLCGSQLFEIKGLRGKDNYLPHLLGHEASGTVIEVGHGVTKVKVGEYVVVSWIKGSGANAPGGIYRNARGKSINSGSAAVFTEYAVVAENRVTPINRNVPPLVVALLGCAVATGAGVIKNTLAVQPKSSIAIFGVGGIGASAVMMAKTIDASPIIAIDVSPRKLAWAKQLGATHGINAARCDPVAAIKKIVPAGLDFTLEASGQAAVGEQAFAVLANTGTLAIAGHPKTGSHLTFDPYEFVIGKKVVGSWGGGTNPDRDFPRYAQDYLRGKLPLASLITHTYDLPEINTAMATLAARHAGRIVLTIAKTKTS